MELKEKVPAYKPLDIKEIFRKKNPSLARFIPGFIFKYLRRMLHLDEVNEFLNTHGDKQGLAFVEAAINDFNVKMDLRGEENIPESGRYIFVSNHPLGGFDGLLLIFLIGKRYSGIKVLSNDILMNIKNLQDIFVPVNKHGAQSFDLVRKIEDAFNSDNQILTFPAGLVSRRRKGVIRDPKWKKNFITKAVRHKRDIVPVHVSGRCTGFFYNFANIRKFLGIKYNLEMFFLPDESYRHRNGQFTITFGKPVSTDTFDRRFQAGEWALKMQDYIYTLSKDYRYTFGEFLANSS